MKFPRWITARHAGVVFRKEITELFRDLRTVLVSIGVPLVLFPLLAAILAYGGESGGIGPPTDVAVSLSGAEMGDISGFLRSHGELSIVEVPASETVEEAVVAGSIDVAVVLDSSRDVTVVFDNTHQRSLAAGELVTGLLKEYLSQSERTTRVAASFAVRLEPIHPPAEGAATLILSFLLPMVILVSAAIGPLASAADLGAGEKERRTLEALLGSPGRRSAILIGKFAAVSTMGLLGVFSFVAGAGLAYLATRTVTEGLVFTLTAEGILSVAYPAVLAALTLAAFELVISLYARSSKAAQTFSVPVLIVASAVGYATVLVDMRSLSGWYYHVPLLNLGLMIKGAVLGTSHPAGLLISSVWVVMYLLVAFSLGLRIVNGESVFRSV